MFNKMVVVSLALFLTFQQPAFAKHKHKEKKDGASEIFKNADENPDDEKAKKDKDDWQEGDRIRRDNDSKDAAEQDENGNETKNAKKARKRVEQQKKVDDANDALRKETEEGGGDYEGKWNEANTQSKKLEKMVFKKGKRKNK
jgi:hypothetical protein